MKPQPDAHVGDTLFFETERGLGELVQTAIQHGNEGRAHLYRQVRQQRVLLMELTRWRVPPMGLLKRQDRPVIVLLGDDDYFSTGPSGWISVPKLIHWARLAVIHASGATVDSYEAAVQMAEARRRVLFVETDTAHHADWEAYCRSARPRLPSVTILPIDGAHPAMPGREVIQ